MQPLHFGIGPRPLCLLLSLLAAGAMTADASQGTTRQVSVSSRGASGDGWSEAPSISHDGAVIAFQSSANNLVPNDYLGSANLFVHNTRSRTTRVVSRNSEGEYANRQSAASAVSGNGRFVAFASWASNLDERDNTDWPEIYVHDLTTGSTELVSVSTENGASNNWSAAPSISSDGRYVAFQSFSSNLVAGDTNGGTDIFVRDRATGTTVRASLRADGSQNTQFSAYPAISGDGRFVAFVATATGMEPGDQGNAPDYYLRDLLGATSERVSVNPDQPERFELGHYSRPAISEDGSLVAFVSQERLDPSDTDGNRDVYVRDRTRNTVERISAPLSGGVTDHDSIAPSISADGRFVAFYSGAGNLVALPPDYRMHMFVRDRQRGATELVSLTSAGRREHGEVSGGGISGDGRSVTFSSTRSSRPGEPLFSQIYVRSRSGRITTPRARLAVHGSALFPTLVVGNEQSRVLMLENRGRGTLHGSVDGVIAPFHITDGGGYFTIPAGAAHSVTVAFRPKVIGLFKANLTIDVDGNPRTSRVVRCKGAARQAGSNSKPPNPHSIPR